MSGPMADDPDHPPEGEAPLVPGRWTAGERAVAAFVVGFAAWQFALPAAMLGASRPAMFGWQMISAVPSRPVLVAEHADGSLRPIEPASHIPVIRPDLPFERALSDHLRRIDPTIVAVHFREIGPASTAGGAGR